jgi:hypothetical protein
MIMSEAQRPLGGTGPRPSDAPAHGVGAVHSPPAVGGEGAPGVPWPPEAEAFAARQARRARPALRHTADAVSRLDALAADRDDPGEVVDAIIAGVLADPGGVSLLEAQALLCELGRDEEIAAVIGARITPDLVARVAAATADTREG